MAGPSPEEMTFGRYVRARRRALDLTQEELARAVPCSRVTIRRVEADELRPSKELAAVLADRLGIPAEERDGFVRFARGSAEGPSGSTPQGSATEFGGTPALARADATAGQGGPRNTGPRYAPRHKLPAPRTSFVDRKVEIAQITGLLSDPACRLLTLTGPSGTGKTRLALQAGAEAADAFADGACLVPLGALTDPALVGPTIAARLGIRAGSGRSATEDLEAYFSDRHLLLVLDAFDGLPDAAPLVDELLAAARGLKILATSRTPLRPPAEHNYPVPPLNCPAPGEIELGQIEASSAVRLFTLRAAAAKRGFAIDPGNAAAVAEICRRVDGLPLAIELAAARMALLSPQALLAGLGHRLPILTVGARDRPERQSALRSTIAWSYQLLDEGEQRIFRRLAVFAGGWDLPAAEAVALAGALPGADALETMSSLAGESLIQLGEGPGGGPRFAMLDAIREYGLEQLAARGEEDGARRAHAAFCLRLAEEVEAGLKGREQMAWNRRLAAEHDNFRAALSWAIQAGETEMALRLDAALRMF